MTATTEEIQDFLQSKLHCMSPSFKYIYGNNNFSKVKDTLEITFKICCHLIQIPGLLRQPDHFSAGRTYGVLQQETHPRYLKRALVEPSTSKLDAYFIQCS